MGFPGFPNNEISENTKACFWSFIFFNSFFYFICFNFLAD